MRRWLRWLGVVVCYRLVMGSLSVSVSGFCVGSVSVSGFCVVMAYLAGLVCLVLFLPRMVRWANCLVVIMLVILVPVCLAVAMVKVGCPLVGWSTTVCLVLVAMVKVGCWISVPYNKTRYNYNQNQL